jgi:hypothetical protein
MSMRDRVLVLLVLTIQIASFFRGVETQAQDRKAFLRVESLTRAETDPSVDPHRQFFMIGENAMVTDEFLNNYIRSAGSSTNGMNMIIADFLYNPAGRRIMGRTVDLADIDDSSDMSLGRAPGEYPNRPDYNRLLDPNTVIGQYAFRVWNGRKGFGAQMAAVQGVTTIHDPRLVNLYLSTATGKRGRTPSGDREYAADELVAHVALHSNGMTEFGYGTDPSQRPQFTTLTRGTAYVDKLYVKEIVYVR